MQSKSNQQEYFQPKILRVPEPEEVSGPLSIGDADLDEPHDGMKTHANPADFDLSATGEPELDRESEMWLGDESLMEMASQLSSDAAFLSQRYPSAHETDPTTNGSPSWLTPITMRNGRERAPDHRRLRISRQLLSAASLASIVLLGVTVTVAVLDYSNSTRATSARPGMPHDSANHPMGRDGDPRPTASPNSSLDALASGDFTGEPDVFATDDSTDNGMIVSKHVDSHFVTTDASHPTPVIYYASQAELEGLLDAVDRSPENKIRIGF